MLGQPHLGAPPVLSAGTTLYQTLTFQPVDEPGGGRAAQEDPSRQFRDTQHPSCFVQSNEGVIPGEGETGHFLQLGLELAHGTGVRFEEGSPTSHRPRVHPATVNGFCGVIGSKRAEYRSRVEAFFVWTASNPAAR